MNIHQNIYYEFLDLDKDRNSLVTVDELNTGHFKLFGDNHSTTKVNNLYNFYNKDGEDGLTIREFAQLYFH